MRLLPLLVLVLVGCVPEGEAEKPEPVKIPKLVVKKGLSGDLAKMQGEWVVRYPSDNLKGYKEYGAVIEGDVITMIGWFGYDKGKCRLRLNSEIDPKRVDFMHITDDRVIYMGIYKFDGNNLLMEVSDRSRASRFDRNYFTFHKS